jgi:hypothetical protein
MSTLESDQAKLSSILSSSGIIAEIFDPVKDPDGPRASQFNNTPRRFWVTSSSGDVYIARIGDCPREHFDDIGMEVNSFICLGQAAPGLVPNVLDYWTEYYDDEKDGSYLICEFGRLDPLSPTAGGTLGERLAKEVHVLEEPAFGFGSLGPAYYRGIKITDGGRAYWKECYEDLITGVLSHLESEEYSKLHRQVNEVVKRHVFTTKFEQDRLLNNWNFIGLFLYSWIPTG